ncbi:glycolipid transfer protein domain-containing protein [Tuber borchii]|uniref:Glycolipid transfer protein domain-containing protein n=1 Tax=Tuber borchii TaxID=42251 RepID=A0A2T6ZK14_TUBBO|nr:glycolipid transfer protein domain-containing protein [Tuber borchii]
MATFFSTIKRSFKDVAAEGEQIPTTEFLEAAESLVTLFDLLGSTAFAAVQKDMNGNIKKIRDRQTSHPKESDTLQNLCNNELAEGKRNASGGLLWLHRGLEFTEKALRKNIQNPSEELNISFTNAYGETLKQYHNMLVKGVFTLAMKACPYRADFYKKLGENEAEVNTQLEEWLTALELNNAILSRYLATVSQKIT